ncbi:MAG TPA: phosphatase PAP2 family protein [Cellulomonas sp.]
MEARGRVVARRWAAARELALVLVLYGVYSLVRSAAHGSTADATATAERIRSVEVGWGLHVEAAASAFVARTGWLSVPMSFWYASLHFVATGGVLVWLLLRRPERYAGLRNALVVATAVALALYLVLPTAPPRLLGAPYHDVLAETASVGWWGGPQAGVSNPYAAFPSMHAGWSLWVAVVLHRCGSRRAGRLGAAYALITAAVVVGTGNHWVLDVVGGWLVVAAAVALTDRHRPPRPSRVAGPALDARSPAVAGAAPAAVRPTFVASPPDPRVGLPDDRAAGRG